MTWENGFVSLGEELLHFFTMTIPPVAIGELILAFSSHPWEELHSILGLFGDHYPGFSYRVRDGVVDYDITFPSAIMDQRMEGSHDE